MGLPNPFSHFHPKKLQPVFGGDFNAWEPMSHYAKTEERGDVSWVGGDLPAIGTKTVVPPTKPLHVLFGDFFNHLWKRAEKPTGPQRNFLAQTRVATTPQRPYFPAVAATQTPAFDMLPANATQHLAGMASDWEIHKNLERFSGYAFRGDSRDPVALKAADGFCPPSTRNDDGYIKGAVYEQFCSYMQRRFGKDLKAAITADQFLALVRSTAPAPADKDTFVFYTTWRAIVKSEQFHLGRMLAEETLKGYISTTRAVTVAKGFACKRESKAGWVYCVAVPSGIVVPSKNASQWTKIFGEQEIAMAGEIPWHGFAAARAVKHGMFEGNIFIRNNFEKIDPEAFKKICKLMSGEKQEGSPP